ncbi:MAG: regulatory iron-sulfur-containing complex subunit RicT [Bacteroidales bacterium]
MIEENKDKVTNSATTDKQCCCKKKGEPRGKLFSYNWLKDVPATYNQFDMIEVQFKNTRKGYFRNTNNLEFEIGDWVAVEASPGHDIGQVTLTGKLVALQIKKANLRPDVEFLRVFRKAKQSDLERYEMAKARENETMIRSRKIAEDLKLKMKIGDVEYQGDGNKAIFYYIADERVDFRQLIKILADTFKIRIEMKQIGARQEAGRIGGIGPCGRPLCCSSWVTSFVSVSTSAARFQDISLNPQKLAGQCAKLKCCLNFEVDTYVEQVKRLPQRDIPLETKDATYYHFKTDILKREITYSTDKHIPANLVTINSKRASEIIALNKRGVKPERLSIDEPDEKSGVKSEFGDIIQQDSLTRFDKNKKRNNNNKNRNNNNRNRGGGGDKKPQGEPRQRNNDEKPQNSTPRNNNNNEGGGEKKRRFNNNRRNNKGRNNQSNETKTPKPTE